MIKVDFNASDFGEFSKDSIKASLTGRLATCEKCCSERVIITRSSDPQGTVWSVSCGAPGCTHNIAGTNLAEVVNKWNKELVGEGLGEEDFATEVVVYFI